MNGIWKIPNGSLLPSLHRPECSGSLFLTWD
jgi:hypothetical protein